MKNKQLVKILLAVFPLILIFGGASSAQTKTRKSESAKCSSAQITREINNEIKRVKARYPGKTFRLRVAVTNKTVRLSGKILSQGAYREITDYVNNLKCVRKFKKHLSTGCNIGECEKQYKMCGEACIPCGHTCQDPK